jgi:hypothetical protein
MTMRFLRMVLALIFGLAIAGPETHACPVHSAAPAHHQNSGHRQKAGHCTCPQACCPAGVAVSMPAPTASWTAVPLPLVAVHVDAARPLLPPSRQHLLPFALAPPHLLG